MGHMKAIHSLYHSIELRNDELEHFDKTVKKALDSGEETIYYKNEKIDINYAKYLIEYYKNNNADGTQFKRPEGQ